MSSKTLAIVSVLLSLLGAPAASQDLGLAADDDGDRVFVFDADTGILRGGIFLPTSGTIGDCAIAPDQRLGFVTDGNFNIHVIDLTQNPPVLAGGLNPIPIGNSGLDIEITPDGKFLVASNDRSLADPIPLSIVDIASRTVVNDFQGNNLDYAALDIDESGNVLTFSLNLGNSALSIYDLDHNGQMWLVDELLTSSEYYNVRFAPGGRCFVASNFSSRILASYTTPPIVFADDASTGAGDDDHVASCVFRPQGDAVFVRQSNTSDPAEGLVNAYAFNPATGQIGAEPLFTIPDIANQPLLFGLDTLAARRDGSRIYVPQPGGIEMYDADPLGAGQYRGVISAPIVEPTGIALSRWPIPKTPMEELGIINLSALDVFAGGTANDRVFGKGTMQLAPGAEPFDPSADNVYVSLNDLHFVIPAGSFEERNTFGIQWWNYTGDFYSGTVNMQISFDYTTNWQIRTLGIDASSAVENPALLEIRIGNNAGEFPFAWEEEVNHPAGRYVRYTLL